MVRVQGAAGAAIVAILIAGGTGAAGAMAAPPALAACEGPPVIMMVHGRIENRERLRGYARALEASGLYPQLGGYYLNAPAPLAVFEGEVAPEESTLLVRFPCLAAARAFWFSRAYQEEVRPARLAPSAGQFTVTVHAEAPLPAHMEGRVEGAAYRQGVAGTAVASVPQVAPGADEVPEGAAAGR